MVELVIRVQSIHPAPTSRMRMVESGVQPRLMKMAPTLNIARTMATAQMSVLTTHQDCLGQEGLEERDVEMKKFVSVLMSVQNTSLRRSRFQS